MATEAKADTKTTIIAGLVSAIMAFGAGVWYQGQNVEHVRKQLRTEMASYQQPAPTTVPTTSTTHPKVK